jgi:hypothetical protein
VNIVQLSSHGSAVNTRFLRYLHVQRHFSRLNDAFLNLPLRPN